MRRHLPVALVLLGLLQPAAAEETVPGYIRDVPPEAPAARETRHARIAARRANPPLILVHKGTWAAAPENTLEAYAASHDYGADGNEIDIHRSKDGVLFMFHDGNAERMLDGAGPMKEKTYYEILRMKFKKRYGTATEDTRVPTLAAVLLLARQRDMLLHLDVKEAGLEDDIERLFDAADMWDHIVEVNAGNAERIRAHPKVKLMPYKGSFPEGGRGAAAFLRTPGDLIFTDRDPTPAVMTLEREKPEKPVPLPEDIRVRWGPKGP
jgi:hypothetical protein